MTSDAPRPYVMTDYQARSARQLLTSLKLHFGEYQNCLNCDWWRAEPGAGQCGKFKATPPPEVIIKGCPHWEDLIPF